MSEVFKGLVSVEQLAPQGFIVLRGDLEDSRFVQAVSEVTGLSVPAMLSSESAGERALLWMSPDELALMLPREEATEMALQLTDALAGQHVLVCDVSDARVYFRLHGAALREVLAKLTPIDMAPDAMAAGAMRRTRLAQVAAGIWLEDEATATVFGFRSVEDYLSGLLRTAAAPNSAVGYF